MVQRKLDEKKSNDEDEDDFRVKINKAAMKGFNANARLLTGDFGASMINLAASQGNRNNRVIFEAIEGVPWKIGLVKDISSLRESYPFYGTMMIVHFCEKYFEDNDDLLISMVGLYNWLVLCTGPREAFSEMVRIIADPKQKNPYDKLKEIAMPYIRAKRILQVKDFRLRNKNFCWRFHLFNKCKNRATCKKIHWCIVCGENHGLLKCPEMEAPVCDKQTTMVQRWDRKDFFKGRRTYRGGSFGRRPRGRGGMRGGYSQYNYYQAQPPAANNNGGGRQ